MPYSFNPHQHVKIWLSLDPESFLSKINQSRLIEMRTRNPDDEIHFVYDKRLLSSIADEKLHQFCAKYNIVPHDFTTDIKPKCTTDEESRLVEQYEEQFTRIALGIYVGSLSDITRWLGPVYRLGTYSDFDTTIDTSRLKSSIPVGRPLLLHLNAVHFTDKIQSVDINCDIISVVDEPAALDAIRRIQQQIVKNCSTCTSLFSPYQDYLNAACRTFEALKLPKSLSSPNDMDLIVMHRLSQHQDLCKLRDVIMERTANNAVFAEFIRENGNLGGIVTTIHTAMKRPYTERQMTEWRETLRHNYLMNTVTYTTGAGSVVLSLFSNLLYKNSSMSKKVLPYSYINNKLGEFFVSENEYHFRQSSNANDLSWLKSREIVILERRKEEQLAREEASVTAIPSRGFFATTALPPVSTPTIFEHT